MKHLPFAVMLSALFVAASAPRALAQSAENVAVVINDASPESQRIGEHYASVRGLPSSNVLRISTSTEDAIDRRAYVDTIERPLGHAIKRGVLQDRLLYLVLTKGVPLRIIGTSGLNGTQASIDSELTLLYRRLTGRQTLLAGHIENPYFLATRPLAQAGRFSHRIHDIYLVTRIDAFTTEEALALVDRAQTPGTTGQIVLDQRASASGSQAGDEWLERAARRLAEQGQERRVVLETTPQPARTEDPVLGYYAWRTAADDGRSSGMRFAPGAVAAMLGSFDARTFRAPPGDWRPGGAKTNSFEGSVSGLVGDLIRDGVTGASGQIGEAYILGGVRPDILFPAYLAGFNLAEAFYLAMPVLSWQAVVVGDPLAAPFPREALTREQIEDDLDPATQLPALFARRRLAAAKAANGSVPDAALALMVRAEALVAREDVAGAKRGLEEAAAVAPKALAPKIMLAELEEQSGEHDSAAARYREILDLQPTNVVALNNLAYTLAVRRNSPGDALPLARRAAALAPRVGSVLDTLGWTEHLQGNDTEAARVLARALALEPGSPEIQLHAAVVFAAVGQRQRAGAALREALRLAPEYASREEAKDVTARLAP